MYGDDSLKSLLQTADVMDCNYHDKCTETEIC